MTPAHSTSQHPSSTLIANKRSATVTLCNFVAIDIMIKHNYPSIQWLQKESQWKVSLFLLPVTVDCVRQTGHSFWATTVFGHTSMQGWPPFLILKINVLFNYLASSFSLASSTYHWSLIDRNQSSIDSAAVTVWGNWQHSLLENVRCISASNSSSPAYKRKYDTFIQFYHVFDLMVLEAYMSQNRSMPLQSSIESIK